MKIKIDLFFCSSIAPQWICPEQNANNARTKKQREQNANNGIVRAKPLAPQLMNRNGGTNNQETARLVL